MPSHFYPRVVLTVASEYQGEQHYHEVPIFGPLEVMQRRDAEKRRLCEEMGVRLVEVPYWWDGQLASLACTLHRRFPTLLLDNAEPE